MTGELIPHPELAQCRQQVLALAREVARLLAEGEELTQREGPALLLRYQLVLGSSELAALEAEVAYRRQLRAVELARAALARGRKPEVAVIEEALAAELESWSKSVQAAAQKLQQARAWEVSPALSSEDAASFKSLYRKLVRRLHPDLQGALTQQEQYLWQRVQAAFVACDLESLRDLETLVGNGESGPGALSVWEELERERLRLEKRLGELVAEVARVRASPPFDLIPCLDDASWVARRRGEAEERRLQFEERHRMLALEWKALTETNYDPRFGPH